MAFTAQDERFMRRALALARRGQGRVEPNPMVGAVVVRNGRIVGEGYHRRYGEAHAEPNALAAAGAKTRGATVYVTLEPCCHFGKQPPCTNALIAAGVRRVVAAMVDPFAAVAGKGLKKLRAAGIATDVGLLRDEAADLLAPFINRITLRRPYVIAKWAQSLDGSIATASGESKWISSEESRLDVQKLRGRVDAILVGIGTALADNPYLMARPENSRDIKRIATRIVLDSQCRLPLDSQLVRTVAFAPVMVACAANLTGAAAKRRNTLASRGIMIVELPRTKSSLNLKLLLQKLAAQEYANIMVEGGAHVHASFLNAGLVDEAQIYIAPKILGGRSAIAGLAVNKLAQAPHCRIVATERFGPDLKLTLRLT